MSFTDKQIVPAVPDAALSLARGPAGRRRIHARPAATPNAMRLASRILQALIVPAAVFALWSASAHYGWLSTRILPAPSDVAATFQAALGDGDIGSNLGVSLLRVARGFLFGGLAGLVLGTALGLSENIEAWLGPSFRIITQVPTLVWIPLLMQVLGIDEGLKLVIMIKACLIPITMTTSEGIRNIPKQYLEVAEVLALPRHVMLRRIILPGALPSIFTGIRQGLSHVWISLIIVEMMASTDGIGYLMSWARTLFQLDEVIVCMVIIGVIGFALDFSIRQVETYALRWRRSSR